MNTPRPERPLVYLLRSEAPPDPYVEAFAAAGYRAACLPVLRFTFPNPEALRERLAHPARYGGLVLTSPRATGALAEALRELPRQRAAWQARPVFVVGPRTGEEVRTLGFDPEGAESGTAEALASLIAARRAAAPLLFLSGSRRRDALPRRLDAASVPFEELVVYETHTRTDLAFPEAPDWVAFFSPSGIEAAWQAQGIDWQVIRKAAIGPTTAAALAKAGWKPEAVAADPTPEALVAAIAHAG